MNPRWPTFAALAATTIAIGVTYDHARVDERADAAIKARLDAVLFHDAQMNERVLRARFAMADDFDALTASTAETLAGVAALAPAVGHGDDGVAAAHALVAERAREKLALVERVKSKSAILRNSIRYLPVAAHEARTARPDLERSIAAALEGVLASVAIADGGASAADAVVALDIEGDPALAQLVLHARLIERTLASVDALVERYFAIDSEASLRALRAAFEDRAQVSLARAARFRAGSAALSVALVALVALVLWRLRRLNDTLEEKVAARTSELSASREQYRALLETTHAVPFEIDVDAARFTYLGPQAKRLWGVEIDDDADRQALAVVAERDRERMKNALADLAKNLGSGAYEYAIAPAGRPEVFLRAVMTGVVDAHGASRVRGVAFDVTATKRLEIELRQAQKLESVGRLAAGIAHEINTPVQYANDSVTFVSDALPDLVRLADEGLALAADLALDERQKTRAAKMLAVADSADIGFMRDEIPGALSRALEGLSRVATIVRSMKEFAHPDATERTSVDVNRAVQCTVDVARNEYKYVAEVALDLGEVPSILANASELNQVILNLVVNAAHAIADRVAGSDARGTITVKTAPDGADHVVISVSDTGGGIPHAIQSRIFEPFFTTKEVGRGTGQGLAIARTVVEEKHGGALTFTSEEGRGTTFVIRLPTDGAPRVAPAPRVADVVDVGAVA